MTLLVCGSRGWSDAEVIRQALTEAVEEWGVQRLVHGNARGADRTAANWARQTLGLQVKPFDADWEKHGKAGGVLRNAQMLRESNPDACLAFSAIPITRGTRDMVNRCLRAGIPTYLVTPDGVCTQLDHECAPQETEK